MMNRLKEWIWGADWYDDPALFEGVLGRVAEAAINAVLCVRDAWDEWKQYW